MLISIKGTQTVDGETDSTDLFTQGSLYIKNGKVYIVYEESEVTGYKNSVTTLKLDDNRLTIIRSGASRSHLIIERDCRQTGYYGTPYGQLLIGVYASEIRSEMDDNGGSLYCKYTLDANGTELSVNQLFVDVKPA